MDTLKLDCLSSIYSIDALINLIEFEDTKLARFSQSVSKLISNLGEQRQLNIWPEIVSALKKYRYEISVLPLPFTSGAILTETLIEQINHARQICTTAFPEQIVNIENIHTLLSELTAPTHPFMEWINKEYLSSDTEFPVINLCLPSAKYIPVVEAYLKSQREFGKQIFNLLNPIQLKGFEIYDRIIFCGTTSIYSRNQFSNREYIWRSPRSLQLFFLSFSWIEDRFVPKPDFDIQSNKCHIAIHRERVLESRTTERGRDDNTGSSSIRFDDFYITPLDFTTEKASSSHPDYHEYDYTCTALTVYLEDGSFVYKDAETSSRIAYFTPETRTKKVANTDLETGMFLVVRTEGGGDSIAAVADLLMGKKAEEMRAKQDEWKIAFRKRLYSYSDLSEAVSALLDCGSQIASEPNIRNWRSEETIKPKDFRDFLAILNFSGITENVDDYWNNARNIFRMHIKAGHEISRLLHRQINQASIDNLEKYGRIDIQIGGLTGKLSIIRIESVPKAVLTKPVSQMNRLFNY